MCLGTALYAVATRQQIMEATGARSVSDDDVNASVLADLQQKQIIEMQVILKHIQGRVRPFHLKVHLYFVS